MSLLQGHSAPMNEERKRKQKERRCEWHHNTYAWQVLTNAPYGIKKCNALDKQRMGWMVGNL